MLGGAEARALIKTTRTLRSLPATAEAVANGSLPLAKAALITRVANARTQAALVNDEERLLALAQSHTVDETAVLLARWKADADQDGPAPEPQRPRLHLSRSFEGRFSLDGELDAEDGTIVTTELDRLAERIYRGEAAPDGRVVSASERKAAALVEMARRSLANEPTAPPQPLVMVLVDLETLAAKTGHGNEQGAEIVGGGPIGAESARRLACDAEVARILTNSEGAILDLGRSTRVPNRDMRRALVLRDKGCVIPGCDQPHHWCQAHHLLPWINGGSTDLCNLCLVCLRHHHLIHEGGFGLARGPTGELIFTRPDGSVIDPNPLAA